jgi:hypothetical protein
MSSLNSPQDATCLKSCVRAVVGLCAVAVLAGRASASGVTAYLPLDLEPEVERQIERVLILADEPILKRPFAVGLVQDALPQACEVDKPLCEKVRRYLERYSRDYAVTEASATGTLVHGIDTGALPNSYGETANSKWDLSAQGYVQPNDYLLVAAGADAYKGRTVPVGSMLSIGTNWAQIDVGYRNHWFSPLTESSQLIGTEAPTLPSVTISNYEPLTRLGFQYEFFLARLSEQPIIYNGHMGSGDPKLFGAQFSIEPFPGWSIGVNRLLEYGGGVGLPGSARSLLRNFFHPSGQAQNEGNQQASYISRFILPSKIPVALYAQYAGENNEDGGSYLLGNSALSFGVDFPKIGRYFDATYEYSEWQNTWYNHFIYQSGMSNDGFVLGNWGADQRIFHDGIGARSNMLRVGWFPSFGGYLEERIRTVANQTYYAYGETQAYNPNGVAYPYHHYYDFTLRYSRPWNGMTLGGELLTGRDVFGQAFTRLSAFVRYGGDARTRDDGYVDDTSADPDPDAAPPVRQKRFAEWFVDAGAFASRVKEDLQQGLPIQTTKLGYGPHLALGARRAVSANNDLGVRLEYDRVDGHDLVGLRALDYRYRFDGPIALGVFAGAARYNLATPAFSIYFGGGLQWRDIIPKWDLSVEYKHAQNLARDHLLATDPQGPRPDSFYKVDGPLIYVSRSF